MKNEANPSRTSPRLVGLFESAGPASVELSVYQQGGQGVIREVREVNLASGDNQLFLNGLPNSYVPNSLTILDYEGEGPLQLGPISYRGANLDKQRILIRSIDTRVTVKEMLSNGKVGNIAGKLRAVLGNELAIERADNKRVIIVPASLVELDEGLPAGLSATPSLTMNPNASVEGAYSLRLLYEAGGLAWNARYSAFYDEARGLLTRFEASVALSNGSGALFSSAVVKLLAGANYGRGGHSQLEGVSFQAAGASMGGGRSAKRFAAPQMDASVESVGEVKAYALPGRVTIADGETQQVTLFLTADVPVKREFFLPKGEGYWNYTQGADGEKLPVYIRLCGVNDKGSKLGSALPAGEVNIFQPDASGSQQKTGNSSLGHVAPGESFKLEYGPSSDIKAERKLVEVAETEEEAQPEPVLEPHLPIGKLGGPGMPGDRTREVIREAVEAEEVDAEETEPKKFREEERLVTVHNYKDVPVEVLVNEDVPETAEWLVQPQGAQLLPESASGSATLHVEVPANGKSVVRYRLRWQMNG